MSMNTIVKKPKINLWIKILVTLIPISIFAYLIIVNFIIDQEFNYFYDIGGSEDFIKPYLAPSNRTSEIINDSHREINHRLVYFSIPYTKGSDNLLVSVKFLTDFNNPLKLGIKNNIGWNYTWSSFDNYLNQENNWIMAENLFSLNESYPENNRLSLAFDIFQLANNPENKTFSIDWINITVYNPGILK